LLVGGWCWFISKRKVRWFVADYPDEDEPAVWQRIDHTACLFARLLAWICICASWTHTKKKYIRWTDTHVCRHVSTLPWSVDLLEC
jgi:hypothetical protein